MKSRKQDNIGLEHRKGAGRPSKLRLSIRKSISQQIRRKPYLSLRTLANLVPGKPSHETVWRAMKDLDYTKNDQHQQTNGEREKSASESSMGKEA